MFGRMALRFYFILMISLLAFSHPCMAADGSQVSSEVQLALLEDDWQKVADLLAKVDTTSPSPVLRLPKAHACLAFNHNNESLELFASTANDADRRSWQTWANTLAHDQPKGAIAWYLKGDAHARMKEWKAANEAFDQALQLNSGSYLAWNARGVVAHAVGNTLQARTDFMNAAKAKSDFADAYASRGTLNVYLNSAKDGSAFDEAKRHSADKDPLVPIIGLGCSHYGRKDYAAARKLFDSVPQESALSSLAQRDAMLTELARFDVSLEKAAKVGTSIESIELKDTSGRTIGILASTTGPGKRGGRGGGITRPPSWTPPVRPGQQEPRPGGEPKPGPKKSTVGISEDLLPPWPERLKVVDSLDLENNLNALTSAISIASSQIADRVLIPTMTVAGRTPSARSPGGADSDPSAVRRNLGAWGVRSVYGLLYEIPVASGEKAVASKSLQEGIHD